MRRGVIAGLASYLIWGLFPLYWPLLEPAGALEILAHRMIWSAVVMAVVVTVVRRWRELTGLAARVWAHIAIAAALITVNWGVYIWAVNNDHVVEASLGYFINPLVSVLLGVLVLGERLRRLQFTALTIGVAAVLVISIGTGRVPWLALVLAVSFGLYGLVKRVIKAPPTISLLGEGVVLFLPALAFLAVLQAQGQAHFAGYGTGHLLLMIGAGPVTAIPLLLFGAAARALPLTVLGFLQYVTPMTQFLLGVYWAGEQMTTSRWIGFALIWGALAVFSVDAVRRARARHAQAAVAVAQPECDTPGA